MSDILTLRKVCKSTAQLATKDEVMKAIKYGKLDDNIRISFWVDQTPFFEVVNELKRNYSGSSVYVNVFEELQNRLKEQPISGKLQHQILVDL